MSSADPAAALHRKCGHKFFLSSCPECRGSSLRADDREIIAVLGDGPLSVQEIAKTIRRRAREAWSERHDYDFEWGGDEGRGDDEPLGARMLAHLEAKDAGIKLMAHEIDSRLRSLERRGAVERVQIDGHRPMLWSCRV